MTAATLTLRDFLLARYTENEAQIREAQELGYSFTISSEQMLADIEAKRQILDLTLVGCGDDYERVQRALALPFADHPDYRPVWRP